MRQKGREILGKTIISEETGRKFGMVGDLIFVADSGELLNLVLVDPTKHATGLNLDKDEHGRAIVPFSCVKSVGDYVIVSEKDIL